MSVAQLSKRQLKLHLIRLFRSATKNLIYPNHGGCGLVAMKASEMLTELGIEHTIRIMEPDDHRNLDELNGLSKEDFNATLVEVVANGLEQGLAGWEINIPLHHIVIEVNGILYDADGQFQNKWEMQTSQPVDYETIKFLVNSPLWNSTFVSNNTEIVLESFNRIGFTRAAKKVFGLL